VLTLAWGWFSNMAWRMSCEFSMSRLSFIGTFPVGSSANPAEQRHAFRARLVLMAAEGRPTRSIARDLGTMPRTVSLWRIRFAEAGLAGLADQPRPGGRASPGGAGTAAA
jgi:hypothetical protein